MNEKRQKRNKKRPNAKTAGARQRLDSILVSRGFFSSRSQAAAAVLAGQVSVDGAIISKAGTPVAAGAEIGVLKRERFVSRGGLKLEEALRVFPVDVSGRTALDAGASTGGFTDCLLAHGARKVIAVDVGYGQLDWKLRQDPRVEIMERTNIRYLKCDELSEQPSLATFDLSFISLKKVLAAVIKCLSPGFEAVALIKPQFEAGREKVGKGGVVRDPEVYGQVLGGICDFIKEQGWAVRGLARSPVKGPKGNVEFLIYFVDGGLDQALSGREKEILIDALVNQEA